MNKMGQNEIIKFLKRNKGKKYTATELKKAMGVGTSIAKPLSKLRGEGMIKYEFFTSKRGIQVRRYWR